MPPELQLHSRASGSLLKVPSHGSRCRPQGDIGILAHRKDLKPRLFRDHQGVTLDAGVDVEKGKVVFILPDFVARDFSGNDEFENRWHIHLPIGR